MNLGLSRLPWYGQVAAFLALSAAGSGVFWHWYVRPVQEDLGARRARLATLRGDISRDLASARRVPEFRREAAALQSQLDELRPVLPEERDVADLLRRVEATATESNLTILAFIPQAAATRQLYAEWPIVLQIEGTYHNLGTFLDRISRFPRIINVGDISIRAKDVTVGAATITARFTVTTFVLVDQATGEEPAGRGRGGRGGSRGADPGRG